MVHEVCLSYHEPMSTGTYVGSASLIDLRDGTGAEVTVTLARASSDGSRWFGSVQGLDNFDLDGQDVDVRLPTGTHSRAQVMIDLTGDIPLVRLVGSGPAPI